MSDTANAPGGGGKRPPQGKEPLRPPTGSPLGYTPKAPLAPTSSFGDASPSFVPKLRPASPVPDLVEESEGWEDDTIATGGSAPGPTPALAPAASPKAAVVAPPAAVASPRPGVGLQRSPSIAPSPLGARRDLTPAPGNVAATPAASSSEASTQVSDAMLQKILDDVRFATRREIPRLVEGELQAVVRAQQEIVTRLDRLEAMIRAAQATADEALRGAPVAGPLAMAAAPTAFAPAPAAPAPAPAAPAPAAYVAPVAPLGSVVPVAYAAPAAPAFAVAPPPAYTPVDIDIPDELTTGKGRGVKVFLLFFALLLLAFGGMVISSNMH